MTLSESKRKYILLIIVLIVFIGIISAKVMAKDQDENFATDDALYKHIVQLHESKNYAEASSYVSELLKSQPNSELVNNYGAIIAASLDETTQAAILYQKTLDINPYNVESPLFMLQYAEVLVQEKRYEDAKKILTVAKDSRWAPEEYPDYQQRVNELLTYIENQ